MSWRALGTFLVTMSCCTQLSAELAIERIQRLPNSDSEVAIWLKFVPDPIVIEALDASVELRFKLSLRDKDGLRTTFVTLRFKRMLNRYELEIAGVKRYFRLKAELFDAFSALVIGDAQTLEQVRMQLDLASLPSALRLPALLNSRWWLDSGWADFGVENP
jgi:hypothetical protein